MTQHSAPSVRFQPVTPQSQIYTDNPTLSWARILKFGTKLDSDELYCVTKEQPHILISPFKSNSL